MAKVFIRKAKLLRAEQNRNGTRCETLANGASAGFEASQRMLQVAVTNRGSADDERAIGHSVSNGSKFLGARQNLGAAYCGTRLAKGAFEWVDDPQVLDSEVTQGTGGRADVERISRGNEYDAKTIEFARKRQGAILCQYPFTSRQTIMQERLSRAERETSALPVLNQLFAATYLLELRQMFFSFSWLMACLRDVTHARNFAPSHESPNADLGYAGGS